MVNYKQVLNLFYIRENINSRNSEKLGHHLNAQLWLQMSSCVYVTMTLKIKTIGQHFNRTTFQMRRSNEMSYCVEDVTLAGSVPLCHHVCDGIGPQEQRVPVVRTRNRHLSTCDKSSLYLDTFIYSQSPK